MNRMNRKLEYALMALKHMSAKTPGELTTAKEVVEEAGCPFDATARVMQQMAQKGLLKSEQGAHGGYQITKDLSKVSLSELIEIIMGPLGVVKCLHGNEDNCELVERCNILSPVSELNRRLKEFYKSVSVGEILRASPSRRPVAREQQESSSSISAK